MVLLLHVDYRMLCRYIILLHVHVLNLGVLHVHLRKDGELGTTLSWILNGLASTCRLQNVV